MPFGDPMPIEGGGSGMAFSLPAEPVKTYVEAVVTGDPEVDVISLCMAALDRLPSYSEKMRVANYVVERVADTEEPRHD